MKATITVEFTDEELEKYAVRVARRAGLNFIHDSISHLGALKIPPIPPGIGDMIGQALSSVLTPKQEAPPVPVGIDAEFEPRTKCERIVGDAHIDEGWVCHNCNVYNGVQRDKCRNCNHERCDVVVPPSPPPADPSAH